MQKEEHELKLASKVVPPHLNPATMKKDIESNAINLGSKEALEYVSWLVNPNRLFDVALTTYDFELVTLVATQTQKDPKEYVPYLQELKAMPVDYMKFKVHFDLKDFATALQMIA
jgi:elongator complex protein 1